MRRFFVPPELSRGEVFEFPEREARHATQVLRLESGDEITVLDGAGGVMDCVVEAATKRVLRVAVKSRQHRAPLPCPITLVQAMPKGPAFETIVQKATELGAARIIPLLSERVVVHISERDAAAKVEKWTQIAIESIKQCGSPWLPVIESPVSFEQLIAGRKFLSAGAGDFPVARSKGRRHGRAWRKGPRDSKVPGTGRQECLPYGATLRRARSKGLTGQPQRVHGLR